MLPRDVKFYDQLLGQANYAVQAANLKHEVFRRIHKTFITPIDPEDIQAIASALDLVVDSVEAIGYRLCAYRFRTLPPPHGCFLSLCGCVYIWHGGREYGR